MLLQQARKDRPKVFKAEIIPPLIVTGQPRTGTTSLHRLLAALPGSRALQYWELMHPFPLKGAESREARIALADKLLKLRRKLTPELDATHYIRPDSPEECMFMLGLTFHSRIFWNVASVHGWLGWYNRSDRGGKYREYADMLRWYQAQYPGERLVLKAPDHVDGIADLLAALPGAMVVQTHRDPVEQFGSYLSLGEQTRRIAARVPQRSKDTQSNIVMTHSANARNTRARTAFPGRVVDVEYNRLTGNPVEAVEEIHRKLGLAFGREQAEALRSHARRNKKGKHGVHALQPGRLRADPERGAPASAGHHARLTPAGPGFSYSQASGRVLARRTSSAVPAAVVSCAASKSGSRTMRMADCPNSNSGMRTVVIGTARSARQRDVVNGADREPARHREPASAGRAQGTDG